MVILPKRAIPLQYILPFYFGDEQIVGADLGTGLHVALPMLNSQEFLTADFVNKDRVASVAKSVNILFGIGVDKQPSDLDWAKSCYYLGERSKPDIDFLDTAYGRASQKRDIFPLHTSDVFETPAYMKKITDTTGRKKLDFIFTSFLRHQLGRDSLVQEKLSQMIGEHVRENGIWVDVGEELVKEGLKDYENWGVNVHKIVNRRPKLLGTAFKLTSDQRDIKEVKPDFFKAL